MKFEGEIFLKEKEDNVINEKKTVEKKKKVGSIVPYDCYVSDG